MNLRQAHSSNAAAQTLMDADDIDYLERRWARRKDVATAGTIISPDLSIPIPCIVRDFSSTGARLELVASQENLLGARTKLPHVFTLIMRVDRFEVECATAWRRSGNVGVRFLSTPRPIARVAR